MLDLIALAVLEEVLVRQLILQNVIQGRLDSFRIYQLHLVLLQDLLTREVLGAKSLNFRDGNDIHSHWLGAVCIRIDAVIHQKTVGIKNTAAVKLLYTKLPPIRHLCQDLHLARLNHQHLIGAFANSADELAALVRAMLHCKDPFVFDDLGELIEIFNVIQRHLQKDLERVIIR